jgi:hypothetical protein
MSVIVTLGLNALDPRTWTTHEVEDVCLFLSQQFGDTFPATAKIFHGDISLQKDVTPKDEAGIDRLQALTGQLYVVVYPEAVHPVLLGGILVASLIVAWVIEDKKKQEPSLRFGELRGSPNNKLGDRQNVARVLGRIPDIYGLVRSTPDLLQLPYTTYSNHRETQTTYMCISRGDCLVADIREGDTLVGEVDGLSYAVYGPGAIPTGNPGTDNPVEEFGEFIDDPVFTVRQVEGVNGQVLEPDNAFTILGDIPGTVFWSKAQFKRITPTTGKIYVDQPNMEKVSVGDTLRIIARTECVTTPSGLNIFPNRTFSPARHTKNWVAYQDGTGAIPDLGFGGNVVVTGFNNDFFPGASPDTPNHTIDVDFSASGSAQAQWALIDTYVDGIPSTSGSEGSIGNGSAMITPIDKEWVGPFFMDDLLPPGTTRTVVCNFVAPNGLYVDDGKSQKQFDVEVEIEVTAADQFGLPVGSPAEVYPANPELRTVQGAISRRSIRALTVKFSVPEVQGPFLVRCRRLTRTPWKQDAPSQYNGFITDDPNTLPTESIGLQAVSASVIDHTGTISSRKPNNGGGSQAGDLRNSWYLPFSGRAEDEIRWTHCYSLTGITQGSFGSLTTIRTRTIVNEGAKQQIERRLNVLAYRRIPVWNGVDFDAATTNNLAENVLFHMLQDTHIGNLPAAQIDFAGIADAFSQVRAHFGGPDSDGVGGDAAGQFNYTFDDENTSLEEIIATVCEACFAVPYRVGDIVKVRPDIATSDSVLLINHRNRLIDTEQRTVVFGTEEDYDGIRIDYVDIDTDTPNDDEVKTYTIPPLDVALHPKVLTVPGIRTHRHAAWHAWREYNRLLHQNTAVEMEVTEEAALLALEDRILIADGTRDDTEDGEIVNVSGSTLTTSQDVTVGSDPSTMFLQHTDGTVEAIAIASNPDARTVILASAPSVTLVTNSAVGVPTKYQAVRNSTTTPTAFRVREKSHKERGVYNITALNYSHAFYWNDGMRFWLPFITQLGLVAHADWGPYALTTSAVGGGTVGDATRGTVWEGTTVSDHISITTSNVFAAASYTKSAWVFRSSGPEAAIICSVETSDERFLITVTDALIGGHGGVNYVTSGAGTWPNDEWAMATLTYDAVSDTMILYINGEQVDFASSVPGAPNGNLRIFGQIAGANGLVGRGDDCRYYGRVLSSDEIRELYLKTRL